MVFFKQSRCEYEKEMEMRQYSLTVCASLTRDRLEVEIQRNTPDEPPEEVALVYRTSEGWGIDYADAVYADAREPEFDAAVERAQELLGRYKDRNDEEPPEGLTAAGMAAWLMEEDEDSGG